MQTIQEQLNELQTVVKNCGVILPRIEAALPPIIDALKKNGRILTCGNGGSAADAMHLTEELVGRYRANRPAFSAICLNADPTALTCIANDWNFATVFSRQVEAHGRAGDCLICFTTSGDSNNIISALDAAKKRGLRTIALLGKDGGRCKGLADFEVIVPSNNTARIQEIHGWILHVILEAVEAALV